MTILIQNVNNTLAGYQKEILPSSWSPIVKYSVIILTVRTEKEALGANIKKKLTTETHQYYVMECENIN